MDIQAPVEIELHDGWLEVVDRNGITVFDDGSATGEYGVACSFEEMERIVLCINACAGKSDAELLEMAKNANQS